jgi:hypothetical protein
MSKKYHLQEYITVNNIQYRLYPKILTNDEYQDMYQAFLEFIRQWQYTYVNSFESSETYNEYSDILMWIEYIDWSNIYTQEFVKILTDVYIDELAHATNNIEQFTEFYGSLFLNFHPELLDILQGRTYHMLQTLYSINITNKNIFNITEYSWRWIIPYYNISVPIDQKKGLLRMNHLKKATLL